MSNWIAFPKGGIRREPQSNKIRKLLEERYGDRKDFLSAAQARCSLLGMTNNNLADRLGVHPAQVSRWFSGATSPALETVLHIDSILAEESRKEWWP